MIGTPEALLAETERRYLADPTLLARAYAVAELLNYDVRRRHGRSMTTDDLGIARHAAAAALAVGEQVYPAPAPPFPKFEPPPEQFDPYPPSITEAVRALLRYRPDCPEHEIPMEADSPPLDYSDVPTDAAHTYTVRINWHCPHPDHADA